MSLGDITLVKAGGLENIPTYRFRVQAGATTINAGEPVKVATAGAQYVVRSATSEPVTGTPTFVGIAATTSTQTASVDGFVEVYKPIQGVVFRASAKTKANINTVALVDVLRNRRTLLDLTSGVYTVAEATADSGTNGIVIVDGDPVAGTLDFEVRASVLSTQ
jgi:hypothetical protein